MPEDLSKHDCVALEGLQTRRLWCVRADAAARSVSISPRFSVNTADPVIEAATAGLGIARFMSYQAAGRVGTRRLVPVLADQSYEPLPEHLVHRHQRSQPLKSRAFVDLVAPRLKLAINGIASVFG